MKYLYTLKKDIFNRFQNFHSISMAWFTPTIRKVFFTDKTGMALCVDEGIKGLADNCKQVTSAPEEILSGTLVTDNLNVLMQAFNLNIVLNQSYITISYHKVLDACKKTGKTELMREWFLLQCEMELQQFAVKAELISRLLQTQKREPNGGYRISSTQVNGWQEDVTCEFSVVYEIRMKLVCSWLLVNS